MKKLTKNSGPWVIEDVRLLAPPQASFTFSGTFPNKDLAIERAKGDPNHTGRRFYLDLDNKYPQIALIYLYFHSELCTELFKHPLLFPKGLQTRTWQQKEQEKIPTRQRGQLVRECPPEKRKKEEKNIFNIYF